MACKKEGLCKKIFVSIAAGLVGGTVGLLPRRMGRHGLGRAAGDAHLQEA